MNKLFLSLILLCLFLGTAFATTSLLDTDDDSYYDVNDCVSLQAISEDLDLNYELINDVNCYDDTQIAEGALYNAGSGFEPIGTCGTGSACWFFDYSYAFTGNFDGNNYNITGLYINHPEAQYLGLFGVIGSSATISNVNLVDAEVTGYDYVGALVGTSFGTITNSTINAAMNGVADTGALAGSNHYIISNCSSSGTVTGIGDEIYALGGLVGDNEYLIENSSSSADVNGGKYAGGLVGYSESYAEGTGIINSYSTGDVYAEHYNDYSIGGLIGENYSTVQNCYATGNVTGTTSIEGEVGEYSEYVGGLIGYTEGDTYTSYATGTVYGTNSVGGLIGGNYGTVDYSNATGNVYGNYGVGGLVGNNSSDIYYSYSTGKVYGEKMDADNSNPSGTGGFVGINEEGNIYQSYSYGDVNGYLNVGGFSGANGGNILDSYTRGKVTGNNAVGGFTGESRGNIYATYATGMVSGNGEEPQEIGGFVGNQIEGSIYYSYSTGRVSNGTGDVGGFIGYENGDIYGDAWLTQEGLTAVGDGSSVDIEVTDENTFFDPSNEFIAELYSNGDYDWDFDSVWLVQNNDYPVLRNALFVDANSDGYYDINSCDELQNIKDGNLGANYELLRNIDCSETSTWNYFTEYCDDDGEEYNNQVDCEANYYSWIPTHYAGFEPIGYCGPADECNSEDYTYLFTGNLNGNNYTINSLYIDVEPFLFATGLFGRAKASTISNVGLVDANISGPSYVGSLVGYLTGEDGNISNCYSTGNVVGAYVVGGLAGRVDGIIENSHSSANIQNRGDYNPQYYGGLAGGAVSITNSYATGNITVTALSSNVVYAGGLAGSVYGGPVLNSYATGDILVSGSLSSFGFVGGLLGELYEADMNQCYSNNALVSGFNNVGGLMGQMYASTVYDSYSWSDVNGNENVGGLIGYFSAEEPDSLYNSYSTGSVTGNDYVGGLVGYLYGEDIQQSFTTSTITVAGENYGGAVGYDDGGLIGDLYWNKTEEMTCTNLSDEGCEIIDNNAAHFYSKTNEPLASWDFDSIWLEHADTYPTLRAFIPSNPEIVYVSSAFNVSENSCGEHTCDYDGFDDISAAIGGVAEGGIVYLLNSSDEDPDFTFEEEITINKSVNIVGEELEDDKVWLYADTTNNGFFIISASDVNIQNLKMGGEEIIGSEERFELALVQISEDVENTIISNNELFNGGTGVLIYPNYSSNKVLDNNFNNLFIGIFTLTGAEITGNEFSNSFIGSLLGLEDEFDLDGLNVSQNLFNTTQVGIFYMAGDQSPEATVNIGPGNIITENEEGIYIMGPAYNVHINGNKIYGNINDESGLHTEFAYTGLDATGNWWGDINGPKVYTDVNEADYSINIGPGTNAESETISITEDSYFIFYRPFCIDEDCNELSTHTFSPTNISGLFSQYDGTMTVPDINSDTNLSSITQINVVESTIINIPIGENNTTITLPAGTIITKSDGNTFNALDLSAEDMSLDALSGFTTGELIGAFQWGIPSIGLAFNPAISVDMFVGTEYSGEVLTLQRSLSTNEGWVQDGLIGLNGDENGTCTVSAQGVCSFQTTLASYYGATKTATLSTPSTGGSCNSIWTCTEWTKCNNETQTRTCTDTRCNRANRIETQSCTTTTQIDNNTPNTNNINPPTNNQNTNPTDQNQPIDNQTQNDNNTPPQKQTHLPDYTSIIIVGIIIVLIIIGIIFAAEKKKKIKLH